MYNTLNEDKFYIYTERKKCNMKTFYSWKILIYKVSNKTDKANRLNVTVNIVLFTACRISRKQDVMNIKIILPTFVHC